MLVFLSLLLHRSGLERGAFCSWRIPSGMHALYANIFAARSVPNRLCRSLGNESVPMPQRTIRLPEATNKQIEEAAERGGFSSPTAFIRYAIQQKLAAGSANTDGTEERLGANLDQLRREVLRMHRAQQALFAYVDTLGKTILTCIPEPAADARSQAVARAKERYDRLLKTVGKALAGDAQAAMQELTAHVEQ